ncbi:MAG: tripartite tricarboxylate transporter substrate binding protein [Betaproteobacteria bacterium]|nr:tripartite tricarboxylate transporter substrate binding protein [Betaproteobacteria bacterium]
MNDLKGILIRILGGLGVLAVQIFGLAAQAEAFPSKPVKIVIPYPISGPADIRGTQRMTRTFRLMASTAPAPISDTLARVAAHAIRPDTRHAVVLERHPGAVTTRGALAVLRAPADGHTLLLASNATMVINPHYFHDVPYEPSRDFVVVAPLATMPFVLLVHSSLPADSPQGLVRWLKPRPGEVNFGSSGDGSTGHLAGELFRRTASVNMVHVSFNGGVAALNGLAARQVQLMFAALPLALPYLANRHFRPLAVSTAERIEELPMLPTLAESGLRGYDIEGWYGMFARADTPLVAIAWLRSRIRAVISDTSTRPVLRSHGLRPATMPLEQFATRIHTESDKWAPILRASRLPPPGGA